MKRGQSGVSALLAIDKPKGMSSHGVVDQVRRIFGEKRVGHAGTLDPLASGVLLVGVGQATRLSQFLTSDHKSYRAYISFGKETTTDDAEGELRVTKPVPAQLSDAAFARQFLADYVGFHDQVPPDFSALHINGKRAYTLARAGKAVQLESRRIEVRRAALVAIKAQANAETGAEFLTWVVDFTVSKGTYIRSLARDIGRALESAAFLSDLVRLESGHVHLDACVTLDALKDAENPVALCTDPVLALGCYELLVEAHVVDGLVLGKAYHVQDADPERAEEACNHELVGITCDGKLFSVGRVTKEGIYSPSCVFPRGILGVSAT